MEVVSSPKDMMMREAEKDNEVTKVVKEPRNYQLELLRIAMTRNSIVFLGTGSGKTFIAVKLIEARADHFIHFGKKCVFLVPTVPLAIQQSSYLSNNLALKVRRITGNDNVDSWTSVDWSRVIEEHQVFVMVHQVFVNAINRAFFDTSLLSLLIVDECHHATKDHPFAQIMERVRDLPGLRILGLTASIVVKKASVDKFKGEMDKMEAMMKSQIITVTNLAHLLKYVTCPEERFEFYNENTTSSPQLESIQELALVRLDSLLDSEALTMSFGNDVAGKIEDDRRKRAVKAMKKLVTNVVSAIYELGISGAVMIAKNLLEGEIPNLMATALRPIKLQAAAIAAESINEIKCIYEAKDDGHSFSSKVQVLSSILSSALNKKSSSSFSFLIFVQRRVTANALCSILTYLSTEISSLSELRVDFVVGGNHKYDKDGKIDDPDKALEEALEIDNALKKFYVGETNCMVATQVLEEGIDVKQCNLVVRFDEIQTLRSYVQSKGRARARPSEFVILVPNQDRERRIKQIYDYRRVEQLAIDCAHGSTSKANSDANGSSDGESVTEVYYSDPMNKSSSPRVDSKGAVSLIYQYVQSLPCDKYTELVPWFQFVVFQKDLCAPQEFRCLLTMPHLCPLREPISGEYFDNQKNAKHSTALKAVQMLHEANELDYHLLPRRRQKPVEDEEVDKDEAGRKSGTKRRKRYVPISYASELGVIDAETNGLLGYTIDMTLKDGIEDKFNLKHYKIHKPQDHPRKLMLLVQQELPQIALAPIELYSWCGTVETKLVKYNRRVVLNNDQLELANFFHNLIFREVTRSLPSWLEASNKAVNDPIVLPVFDNVLDFKFIRELKTSFEMWMTREPNPFQPSQFDDAVIVTTHKEEKQRYFVEEACLDLSANSLMPGDQTRSFKDYYRVAHIVEIVNSDDCMLRISNADTEQNAFSKSNVYSSRKCAVSEPPLSRMEELARHNFYVPELVRIHPVPASLWRDVQLLPFILHRVDTWIKINDFISSLCSEGRFIRPIREDFQKPLRPWEVVETHFNNLLHFDPKNITSSSITEEMSCNKVVMPLASSLLRALTFRGAMEDFDLEREEMLGDSFLKYAASVFVFMTKNSLLDEGELTAERTCIISNRNLFQLAKRRSLEQVVQARQLKPSINWRPPRAVVCNDRFDMEQLICDADEHFRNHVDKKASYTVFDTVTKDELEQKWRDLNESVISPVTLKNDLVQIAVERKKELSMAVKPVNQSLISDKGLADCVEALIGAFLLQSGHRGALQFLKFMGQDLLPCLDGKSESDEKHTEDGWFEPLKTALLKTDNRFFKEQYNMLVGRIDVLAIEKSLNYKFGEQSFLLQALTHASYSSNKFTESLERLEFLGDAVLDFLITAHLYTSKKKGDLSPGQLTAERSSLVNNDILARIAVEKGLHAHLLHFSTPMLAVSNGFVTSVKKAHDDEDQEKEGGIKRTKMDRKGLKNAPKFLADVVEALIGAVYMDSKFNLVQVWTTIKSLYDLDFIRHKLNAPTDTVPQ